MLDAIHGRRPTVDACIRHWREGAVKGAIYSFVFMLLVQLGRGCVQTPAALADRLRRAGADRRLLAGTLLYPLGRTIIESFDGTAPFFHRLRANAAEPDRLCARPRGRLRPRRWRSLLDLPLRDAWLRFLFGAAVGALAYAGVDLAARPARRSARGERQHLQIWRVYALGAFLGGITGGAVAWYLDAAQVAVIAAKFAAYATVHAPGPRLHRLSAVQQMGRAEPRARPRAACACSTTSRCRA